MGLDAVGESLQVEVLQLLDEACRAILVEMQLRRCHLIRLGSLSHTEINEMYGCSTPFTA